MHDLIEHPVDARVPAEAAPESSPVRSSYGAKLIPQHANVLGSPSAPVTLVEYGDLQCPICRSFAVDIMRLFLSPSPARTVGPALASMLIYLLMALVLYFRPTGLFPAKGR